MIYLKGVVVVISGLRIILLSPKLHFDSQFCGSNSCPNLFEFEFVWSCVHPCRTVMWPWSLLLYILVISNIWPCKCTWPQFSWRNFWKRIAMGWFSIYYVGRILDFCFFFFSCFCFLRYLTYWSLCSLDPSSWGQTSLGLVIFSHKLSGMEEAMDGRESSCLQS